MATKGESTHAISPKSKAEEKYVLINQTYQNTASPCRGNTAVSYQTELRGSSQSTGCCLTTTTMHEKEKYQCGTRQQWVQTGSSGFFVPVPVVCSRTVTWEACSKWEELFHCSDDGGLTQSGQRFRRISDVPGECVGDLLGMHSSLKLLEGNCPERYLEKVAGRECQCPTACG
jgi:hypothetical protein